MAKTAQSAEDYFNALPEARRKDLSVLRDRIRSLLPKAQETMACKMPTYEIDGFVCAIASQKHHMSLYLCDAALLEKYKNALAHLDLGKGCVRFKKLEDLPMDAVEALIREAGRGR